MIDRTKYLIDYGSVVNHFTKFGVSILNTHNVKDHEGLFHNGEVYIEDKSKIHIENMLNYTNRKIDSLLSIIEFLEDKLDEYFCNSCE